MMTFCEGTIPEVLIVKIWQNIKGTKDGSIRIPKVFFKWDRTTYKFWEPTQKKNAASDELYIIRAILKSFFPTNDT